MKLDYEGASIFYHRIGVGKPLVFLHGFLESSQMWGSLVSSLSNKLTCILIDMPGHGLSGGFGEIHSMQTMADIVKEILKNLKIPEATFIGHSMGGYVALALADSNPEYFAGLCLMCSTALDDSPEKKKNRERAANIVKKDKNSFIGISITNLFAEENRQEFVKEINKVKNQAYKMTVKNIVAALLGMKDRANHVEVLKGLKCKKLIILGSKDEVMLLQDQLDYLKNMVIEINVLESGHMPHIESKEEITYIIKQFSEK